MGKNFKVGLHSLLCMNWEAMKPWDKWGEEGRSGVGREGGGIWGVGELGLIYVRASNAVSGMQFPLRLCVLVSWEVECKWSRLLGEVGYSHGPMLGPAYAVAKQVFFVIRGPWGWAKQISSSAALLLKQKYSSLQTLFIRWKTLLRERYK